MSRVVDTEPQLLTLKDAVASKFAIVTKEQLGASKGATRGAIYDAQGDLVLLSQRRTQAHSWQTLCVDPPRIDLSAPPVAGAPRLAGRSLYLGNFANHYGHFVTEFLSRLWILARGMSFDHVVTYPSIANCGRYLPQEFHRYMLGLLGLDLTRLEILRAPVRFDEIVVPEQLWIINTQVNTHLRDVYEKIAAAHRTGRPVGRVFLARSDAKRRKLRNAREIEEVFASFGFAIVEPQDLPIARQLRLYADCEMLAGYSGSGLHNSVFCRPGTPVIDVGDFHLGAQQMDVQWCADRLARTRPVFIPYRAAGERTTDIAALTADLSSFLGERPRSSRAIWFRARRLADWITRPGCAWRRSRRR